MIQDIDILTDFSSLYTQASSRTVVHWLNLYEKGSLTGSQLWEHWYDQTPSVYRSHFTKDLSIFDTFEPVAQLLEQMTEFVYKGQSEPIDNFIRSRGGNVDQFCGKVFKTGEPSYSCRQCGTDGTSVLCVQCFQKSEHRKHRYKMATSCGGGFCDCGDPEAWINDHFCDIHKKGIDSDFRIPSEFYQRCTTAFKHALSFVVEVMNKNYHSNRGRIVTSNQILIIYNDEVHSFNQVIDILSRVLPCSHMEGLMLASKINREGRALVAYSSQKRLSKTKLTIERLSATDGIRPLDVQIVPFEVVATQQFASQLLNWAVNLTRKGVDFRSAFVDALQTQIDNKETTLLDQILLQDPSLWKYTKIQWHSSLCSVTLVDSNSKKILAHRFARNYPQIVTNHVNDDDDLTYSAHCLSVQLYTAPSIARELIEKYGAFKIAVEAAYRIIEPYVNSDGKFEFGSGGSVAVFKASGPFQDVKYLLGTVQESSPELICGFVEGANSLLTVLGRVQGMNSTTRQLGSHVEYEPEWETGFKLASILNPIVDLVVKWCSSNERMSNEIYRAVLSKIHENNVPTQYCTQTRTFGNFTVDTISYDAVVNPVSLHLPLTRFWADMYSLQNSAQNDVPQILEVVEPILRTRVMLAQFRSGTWKKNGNSLSSQIFFYHNSKFRAHMLEKDVLALQITASQLDADIFLVHLLSKFELLDWTVDGIKSPLPEMDSHQLNLLVDEFLYLLIVVISERRIVNVEEIDRLSNLVVHQLALKTTTMAELVKNFAPKVDDTLETVVELCAQFKTTDSSTGKGHYDLKDEEYPSNFNAFHCNYSKEDSFKSEQKLKQRYKRSFCPPPELPPFQPIFARTADLLKSDVLLQIVDFVLNRWIDSVGGAEYDGQVKKTLFLVGLALNEEKTTNGRFGFVAKARNWTVDVLLVDIYRNVSLKEHKDLVEWTLKLYADLTGDEDISSVLGVQNDTEDDKGDDQNVERKRLAEKAKADILAKMKAMQERFSVSNTAKLANTAKMEEGEFSQSFSNRIKTVTCILCQEDEHLDGTGRVMILMGFIQNSTVHRHTASEGGVYASTCGHVMHADCWDVWTVEFTRKRKSGEFLLPFSYNVNDNEYLCPLCQSIGNSAIPMLAERSTTNPCEDLDSSFAEWLHSTVARLLPLKVVFAPQQTSQSENTAQVCHNPIESGEQERIEKVDCDVEADQNNPNSQAVQWIQRLSEAISSISQDSTTNDGLRTSSLCDAVAYTIVTTERYLKSSDKPLLGSLKTREEDGLNNLIRAVPLVTITNAPSILSDEPSKANLLNLNSVGLLINYLAFEYQLNKGVNKRCLCCVQTFVYRLFLIRQIAQFLLLNPLLEDGSNNGIQFPSPALLINSPELWDIVKNGITPFLRCCAIFRHFFSVSTSTCNLNQNGGDTYDNISKYLRLPSTCSELLDNDETRALFNFWSQHPDVRDYINNYEERKSSIGKCLGTIRKLVDLPEDYCDILNSLVSFRCPNSDVDDPPNPTMCLICGQILCSLSYCCQREVKDRTVGACTFHSQECGGGIGIFLRLRECRLILLAGFGRGCFSTPPYVDRHGEPDEGLRRGNPLRLCRQSYCNLELLWLSHGIYEKVARSADSVGLNITRWRFM